MTEEFRKRVGKFLSEYIDITDSRFRYEDDEVIRGGIRELIEKEIFSIRELQIRMGKEVNVLIPEEFIRMCAQS